MLGEMVESIDDGKNTDRATTVCLSVGEPDFYLRKMFDAIFASTNFAFPQALEILLVPGLLVLMLVHAPVGNTFDFPIPLGLASFDPHVVERVHEMIGDGIQHYSLKNELGDKISLDLRNPITSIDTESELMDDQQHTTVIL